MDRPTCDVYIVYIYRRYTKNPVCTRTITTAMTSNVMDEQRTRGWRELLPLPQGGRHNHGCCKLDEHRMIILGGFVTDVAQIVSSGFIYDARTELSTPLPNNMPAALATFSTVNNERYIYVIGGRGADLSEVNTVYRLSLESYEWSTMAPMRASRSGSAAARKGDYIYVFGGGDCRAVMASVERYSIVRNIWEGLPDMTGKRYGHCAVTAVLRNEIYILGGIIRTRVLEVFDTALLKWRRGEASLCDIPGMREFAGAVLLKNRYFVVIGGFDDFHETAGCFIYNCSINQWSSTPASINMITSRRSHTAAILDGKIVVAGGRGSGVAGISSVECIEIHDILEYAPLDYPLPEEYFNQILQLGKPIDDGASLQC